MTVPPDVVLLGLTISAGHMILIFVFVTCRVEPSTIALNTRLRALVVDKKSNKLRTT